MTLQELERSSIRRATEMEDDIPGSPVRVGSMPPTVKKKLQAAMTWQKLTYNRGGKHIHVVHYRVGRRGSSTTAFHMVDKARVIFGASAAYDVNEPQNNARNQVVVKLSKQIVLAPESRTSVLSFEPTDHLARPVAQGIAVLRRNAENQEEGFHSEDADAGPGRNLFEDEASSDLPLQEARQNISDNVKLVLSAMGSRLQHDTDTRLKPVTANRRFIAVVQNALLECIPVAGTAYDVVEFLNRLVAELIPVAKGRQFGGDWGGLAFEAGELVLRINRPVEKHPSDWIRAKAIRRSA